MTNEVKFTNICLLNNVSNIYLPSMLPHTRVLFLNLHNPLHHIPSIMWVHKEPLMHNRSYSISNMKGAEK